MASLGIWMNGNKVGEWHLLRSGASMLRYERDWIASPYARPLSLSLPLLDEDIHSPFVEHYFQNLLPDSLDIRRRLRTRFGAASMSTFDLLAAIGRDCVGAIQLSPPDRPPVGWDEIHARALTPRRIEQLLGQVTQAHTPTDDIADLRLSIAGAQEKTALLRMGRKWFIPHGATPTTHILKLPMGLIGGLGADFSDSVENEWLCGKVLHALGLPVAPSQIATFGAQKTLIVTRFDRRWMNVPADSPDKRGFEPPATAWIARLPQEDFCQALGLPPDRKYEAEGGPSMERCLDILRAGEQPVTDQATFVQAQFAFWLLAAIDGHGKNFSLHHSNQGYRLTPLYDVLSAWPIIGNGRNQLPRKRATLAMSLKGRRRHYGIDQIQPRHWQGLVNSVRVDALWSTLQTMAERIDSVFDALETSLPAQFPAQVFDAISRQARAQARKFLDAG